MKKLGLIAGNGRLPVAIATEARRSGHHVFAVALDPLADKEMDSAADEVRRISVGKLGTIIDALKKSGVKNVVMAGKVPKSLIYKSRIVPDLRAMKLLFSLKDRSDDSILLAITGELEKEGLTIVNTSDFSKGMMAPEGVITRTLPTETEWKDITFGWGIAKEIGGLDIGQTIVVKDRAVMAVEAIEGTDEAIRRGGRLAVSGAVIIKVSKPNQDMRFDVPVVGPETLKIMKEVKARVLALESKKTIIVDREAMTAEADGAGISIVGVGGEA